MRSANKRWFMLLLAVVCSAGVLHAQTSGAMLYATGDVKLNGTAVADASSVFAGDRIVTANSSIVSVNRSGSSVVVSPNSTVQYNKSELDVIEGAAHVSTINGMSAEVGDVKVAPKDQSAKFDVVRVNNQAVVTSREGTLAIEEGGHTVVLQPGDYATIALGASQGSPRIQSGPFIKSEAGAGVVANGPFYSLVSTDDDLPWCNNLTPCIRPNVSHIRPCKCPPGH